MKPEYFDTGYRLLELDAANETAWRQCVAGLQGRRRDRRVTSGGPGNRGAVAVRRAARATRQRLWPLLAAPGIFWLAACFVFPLYVVLCIVFGQIDPLFRTPVPVWNPLQWDPTQFTYVLTHIVGANGVFGPALLRTAVFVLTASALCLLIAFPVSYYVARLSGKRKGLLLALLIAPFWISYMMRMFAWVNLLQDDGLVNKVLSFGGLFTVNVDWLTGQPVVVILGLVYGYVPYMILPLLRRPRPAVAADAGGVARPWGRPVFVVLAGDAAAVPPNRSWRRSC